MSIDDSFFFLTAAERKEPRTSRSSAVISEEAIYSNASLDENGNLSSQRYPSYMEMNSSAVIPSSFIEDREPLESLLRIFRSLELQYGSDFLGRELLWF